MATRLLMIGMDGADGLLVDRLVADGRMPELARLRSHGLRGKLDPLPGLADDASWTTFATSVSPGIHGRFHHAQVAPGMYFTSNVSRDATAYPPFWKAFVDAGLRVAAVDVPKSPMAGVTDGVEIVDWMPHGEDALTPTVHPVDHKIAPQISTDPDFHCHRLVFGLDEALAHARAIAERGERRRRVLQDLLTEEWDVFIAVLAETHCVGHHFWHFHHASHTRFDEEATHIAGDVVVAGYQAADRCIGECVAAAGPDAAVVVFSLTGMGPNYSATHFLDDVLLRIEGGSPATRSHSSLAWLKRLVSLGMKRLVYQALPGVASSVSANAGRKAFVVPHDAISGAIRLNVKGRESNGSIEPGLEYDHWCRRITDALLALRNAEDGRPVIRRVVRVADEYPGPHRHDFADLLAVWESKAPVNAVRSDEFGEFRSSLTDRAGNHTPGGWFTISGKGIGPAKLTPDAAIVDLGPTATRLLGIALPQSEGHAIDLGAVCF